MFELNVNLLPTDAQDRYNAFQYSYLSFIESPTFENLETAIEDSLELFSVSALGNSVELECDTFLLSSSFRNSTVVCNSLNKLLASKLRALKAKSATPTLFLQNINSSGFFQLSLILREYSIEEIERFDEDEFELLVEECLLLSLTSFSPFCHFYQTFSAWIIF